MNGLKQLLSYNENECVTGREEGPKKCGPAPPSLITPASLESIHFIMIPGKLVQL